MEIKLRNRQRIHYVLIVCIIFIQLIIMLFFYNEYFNGKKLNAIEQQLKESKVLKSITTDARNELSSAQLELQKYIHNKDKKHLEEFFQSLKKISKDIDSVEIYANTNSSNINSFRTNDGINQLNKLEKLIDSTYRVSQKKVGTKEVPELKKIKIKDRPASADVEVQHISDHVEKKGFFPRIKDAIAGKVDVKRDTTLIIYKFKNSVDTSQVKKDIESTFQEINEYYQNEFEKFKSQLSLSETQNKNLHSVYVNLIDLSNQLMNIYDQKVEEFDKELESQFNYQNSLNSKIRKFTVMGLLILTFIVLGILIYYTKLSFQFEKELKEANKKNEQSLNFKNRILGMLSHEVRGPLKIMNLFIQRIQKRTEDQKIIEYLKSIEFTNNSLLIQANQILEYAKHQEKPLELQPSKFNLREEIVSLLTMFGPYIESRNNIFHTIIEIDPSVSVYADNIKIHQLFINILSNANKFTENGKIEVYCHSEISNDNCIKLNVRISDTGIGISESDIKMIFEPYYQGIISKEIENLGAGLGLNLCKEIVQLFNGRIEVESELNKGTTVSFELNLIDSQDAQN